MIDSLDSEISVSYGWGSSKTDVKVEDSSVLRDCALNKTLISFKDCI